MPFGIAVAKIKMFQLNKLEGKYHYISPNYVKHWSESLGAFSMNLHKSWCLEIVSIQCERLLHFTNGHGYPLIGQSCDVIIYIDDDI